MADDADRIRNSYRFGLDLDLCGESGELSNKKQFLGPARRKSLPPVALGGSETQPWSGLKSDDSELDV